MDEERYLAWAAEQTCPRCSNSLHGEIRLEAKPIGTFSLAGKTPKVSAISRPHLVCSECGFDSPGKFLTEYE